MIYTALMIDIINSKKLSLENRETTQHYIKESLNTLNRIFQPSLEFDVLFSAGDEVQGLFKSASAAYLYLRLFRMLLHPIQIRAGIGIAELEIRLEGGTSTEQDGSVYHYAREAITDVHSINNFYTLIKAKENDTSIVNTLISNQTAFLKSQSSFQSKIFMLTELLFPIINSDLMDLKEFHLFGDFILEKCVIKSKEFNDKVIAEKSKLYRFETEFFEINAPNNIYFINSMWKKGMSTKIANAINTSRQNIDKAVKSGYIIEIRNTEASILLALEQMFGRVI